MTASPGEKFSRENPEADTASSAPRPVESTTVLQYARPMDEKPLIRGVLRGRPSGSVNLL